MTNVPDPLLTPQEAAVLYGTTRRTLKRIIEREGTPVQHLNGHYRIYKSDLLALKASQFKPLGENKKEEQS